ncbi:hypothetical protein [Longitalea luteola]|uniref:hypothetical protein n=1 Tax=Longitalea luteola TaxID=2812563 RepID=UPI001A9731C8|nr:hypothetical protein [Longitalea luteola]
MVTPAEYIANEFKKVGKADAFTPELAEQIKNGVPYIKHPHLEVDRDGNKATTTFHIVKSANSDNYFLNKFDMQVQRAGKKEDVQDTFYINDVKRNAHNKKLDPAKFFTTFTVKKAFNYLIGRPVRNLYQNVQNQSHKAWDQIDLKSPLGNGRYELKTCNDNYGFDLDKVAANYSMRELANPQFKKSLFESLERGNLQSAKFVGNDGKITELFVSPNIRLGTLNVFRHDKETNTKMPVQLADLEKNGWINKEFAQTVRERVKEFTQKYGQANKQGPAEKNARIENEKPAKKEEQGEKATKKNKIKEKTDVSEKPKRSHRIKQQ